MRAASAFLLVPLHGEHATVLAAFKGKPAVIFFRWPCGLSIDPFSCAMPRTVCY
jgi:hypothetical protein